MGSLQLDSQSKTGGVIKVAPKNSGSSNKVVF